MRLPPARATFTIGAITALAWAIVAAANLDDAVVPLAGFTPARLSTALAIPGAVPAVLTPLSATLVHGGIAHLGFNLLIFVFCARLVEASIGPACLVLLYLVGAYAAAAAQYLVGPQSVVPIIGASHRHACGAGCDHALDHALITAPEKRDPALLAKLSTVAGRVLA